MAPSFWGKLVPRRPIRRRSQKQSHREPNRIAEVEILEERLVLSPGILAVAAGQGSTPQVKVFDSASGNFLYDIFPYPDQPGISGGVRTAVADVNGDGAFDIVTAPGSGGSPLIRVFNGAVPGQVLNEFFAYDPNFLGGVYVAAADFNLDGAFEIVTGAGEGGGPHVRVFGSGGSFDQLVFAPGFTGGVRVATGDVSGDNVPDLIVAAGPGGGPHVRVFGGTDGQQLSSPIGSFFAYSPGFLGGVYIASANFGGTNSAAEIVTGPGAGGGPHVRIIDPSGNDPNSPQFDLNLGTTQFPFNPNFLGGVRVAAAYVDNVDQTADLIVGAGIGGGPHLRIFRGATAVEHYQFFPYDTSVTGGLFPSASKFNTEALRLANQDAPPPIATGSVSPRDIEDLVRASLVRLNQAGISSAQRSLLESLEFRITDLPDDLLGLAQPGLVILDENAAGFGWFADATPDDDLEFGPSGYASEAQGRVDLMSVLVHEFGHHLGLDHDLMPDSLALGERRLLNADDLDAVFASGDVFGP